MDALCFLFPRTIRLFAFLLVTLGAGSVWAAEEVTPARREIQTALEGLIRAAKAEGQLTFYSASSAPAVKVTAETFESKYGIKTQFIRLSGVPLLQRFSSEAESGNLAADAMLNASNAVTFAEDGVRKGWIEPISSAGIPVIRSGEYPQKFNRGASAIVQIGPWLMLYNSDKVKGPDVPKDWSDLLNPKWKGQLLLANPGNSDAYLDLWAMLLDKYGESFFAQLRAQGMRNYAGGPATYQALAAGEGSLAVPGVLSAVQAYKEKGAPLGVFTPEFTTGVEMQIVVTARSKAKHPNAARLFANYIMSREGNKVLNDDPGGITIYDTSRLPRLYESPRPGALARKDQIMKLLGL